MDNLSFFYYRVTHNVAKMKVIGCRELSFQFIKNILETVHNRFLYGRICCTDVNDLVCWINNTLREF